MDILPSLFEKALNIDPPWKVKKILLQQEQMTIDVYIDFPKGSLFPCPECNTPCKAYDTKEVRLRHLDFFQYRCYLIIRIPRIECKEHGILQIKLPWARRSSGFTLLYESFAMALVREMPVNTVSKLIDVDDNKLWRMIHYYIEKAREYEDYSSVDSIGIDETSMKKGHNYITLVVDLEKKKTIYVTEGKDASAIERFKEDLISHNGSPDNIRLASIDMSPAFIRGMDDNFPYTEIVFDKFHIMKLINAAVDEVRKKEVKEQDILRGTRYIWLKNRDNLTDIQKQTLKRIESMPKLNLKTIKALHIRENFQSIYKENTPYLFERMLARWYFWATHSRIEPIIKAAKTIKKHWHGVVSWVRYKADNGILEGLNSLIQAAKAKARGYRTFKNFSAIVYLITGKLDFSKTGLPT